MKKKILISIMLLLTALTTLSADNWLNYYHNYNDGTEFYVTYMNANTQAGVTSLDIALFMAARQSSFVTISDSVTGLVIDTFTIPATTVKNSYHLWSASRNAPAGFQVQDYYCTVSNTTNTRSIRVKATTPICLYMATQAASSGDASLVMPVNRLGREYVLQVPSDNAEAAEFAVVAVEDSTKVTIIPTQSIASQPTPLPANVPIVVTLAKGEVYFAAASNVTSDLSGTTICADKNIMVFNGSQSMKTSLNVQGHVCHQAMPIHTWGKKFALVKSLPQKKNIVKVTALEDTTTVVFHFANGTTRTETLAPYTSYNHNTWKKSEGNALFIEANHPIICYQYLLPKAEQPKDDDDNYDAGGRFSSTVITPIEQGIQSAMFGTFQHTARTLYYYLNLVCPTAAIATMQLDGVPIPAASFDTVPALPGYSYVSMQIADSAHSITNSTAPFNAIVYALTSPQDPDDWSYAHNVGMNTLHQDAYIKIDGARVKESGKCKDGNNQWPYEFKGIIEQRHDIDSVVWYYDKGRMGTDTVLNYSFNLEDSMQHPIYMYVYRSTIICDSVIVDTVEAAVNNYMTYDIYKDTVYYCHGYGDTIVAFPGTEVERKIPVDSVPVYQTQVVTHRFPTVHYCDSIVHFQYEVLDPPDDTLEVRICQGSSYIYQDSVLTEAGYYVFDEYEREICHYLRTIHIVMDSVFHNHTYDTICDVDLPYIWRHNATEVDTIWQSCEDSVRRYTTAMGCDSINHLHLVVGDTYIYYDSVDVCDNELPYLWHGQSLSASGIYYDNHTSIYGCDSNYTLKLTVRPTYLINDFATICANETYTWHNRTYSQAGIYYDSLLTAKYGCDSVHTLTLTVNPVYLITDTASVCQDGYRQWHGIVLQTDSAGVFHYFDAQSTVLGCDSGYELILTVHPKYDYTVTRVICQGESYEFDGNPTATWMNNVPGFHTSTVYHPTIHGCDSAITLNLTVNPIYQYESVGTTCSNEPYHWQIGDLDTLIYQTTPGTHNYNLNNTTVQGCDSNYHLVLTVNSISLTQRTVFISDQDSVVWDGKVIAGSKYTQSIPDTVLQATCLPDTMEHAYRLPHLECDSITRLIITVCSTYLIDEHVNTCQHESYAIEGHPVWTWKKDVAGTHDTIYRYQTAQGYDSLRHLYVTVNPVYHFTDSDRTCANTDYEWVGHRHIGYLPVGTHVLYDNDTTIAGCDSTYTLYLTVNDTTLVQTEHHICDNEAYTWDNTVFAGTKYTGTADSILSPATYRYRRTYTNAAGCDSFVTLKLVVTPTYEFYDTASTCQHDGYHVNPDDPRLWTLHKDTAGIYDDTFHYTTIYGCDSIRHLHLTVHPEYFIAETALTCSNTAYVWHGHQVTIPLLGPGVYTFNDSLTTIGYGCDSVHQLTLTVLDTIVRNTVHSMCDVDAFTWDGKVYAGTKYQGAADTVLTSSYNRYVFANRYVSVLSGCDSIERLYLTVGETYLTVLQDGHACQGDVYQFSTQSILCSRVGEFTYYDSLLTVNGCDSVIKITLRVDSTYSYETHASICDNETYTWRTHTFSNVAAGDTVITDRYTSVYGCDSTYTLYLRSNRTYIFDTVAGICDYDTLRWRGRDICNYQPGEYTLYDSLKTRNTGCDSVYRLSLSVYPHYSVRDSLIGCVHDTIMLHGQTLIYTVPGVYYITDRLPSVYGCDSVVETIVKIHPTYHFVLDTVICASEKLVWQGKTYRGQSGTYYASYSSQYGCDSIYQLNLTVIPSYLFEVWDTICSDESYTVHGMVLTDQGDHHFKYYTVAGCDSEYIVHLTVHPAYDQVIYDTICSNEFYHFGGQSYNEDGTYYYSTKTVYGCDSNLELHLTVLQAYHTITTDNSHCQGDVVSFGGINITQSGTYYDSLKSVVTGCDSVLELQINFKPSYLIATDTAVCDFKTMRWRGKDYNQSGTYYDSLLTKFGRCDSVFMLTLQMSPTEYETIDTTICQGDTYMFGTRALTQAGTYYDTLNSARDFDCKLTTLNLKIAQPTSFQVISDADFCADDSTFSLYHRIVGEYPVTYSVLFDDAAKGQGFVDLIDEPYDGNIVVPVPECKREEWYVRPDTYNMTVRVDNGYCDPVQNEYKGSMVVHYPSWVIEQRWNDVVAALNEYFNGNYKFTNYEWIVNGSVAQNGKQSYIYLPGRMTIGDIVYANLTREGDNYSISTCPVTIEDRSNKQTTIFHVVVLGDPDPHGALQRIKVHSDVDGRFFISDVSGNVLMNGEASANIPVELEVPFPSGVYFLYFYRDTGEYRTVKFVVN